MNPNSWMVTVFVATPVTQSAWVANTVTGVCNGIAVGAVPLPAAEKRAVAVVDGSTFVDAVVQPASVPDCSAHCPPLAGVDCATMLVM
jgi:hypothetical protein